MGPDRTLVCPPPSSHLPRKQDPCSLRSCQKKEGGPDLTSITQAPAVVYEQHFGDKSTAVAANATSLTENTRLRPLPAAFAQRNPILVLVPVHSHSIDSSITQSFPAPTFYSYGFLGLQPWVGTTAMPPCFAGQSVFSKHL